MKLARSIGLMERRTQGVEALTARKVGGSSNIEYFMYDSGTADHLKLGSYDKVRTRVRG
jgi:hypothetical protein